MHIAIASDHAGFEQKERLAAYIESKGHTVFDLGPRDDSRVDYPDYARLVAEMVSSGDAERGVLICGTGLGMAIAADKLPGIRAAAVTSPEFAALGRQHNDMNVIALSGRFVDPEVNEAIVDEFLGNDFERGRHDVRVCKIGEMDSDEPTMKKSDPKVYAAIAGELRRQRESIELIASENFTSLAVMEASGSVLTNKYAEGYPNKRYYGGCEQVDIAENLAISRATELFGAEFANVQPHSGANANFAAFSALVQPGDKVLGMDLSNGGHLTHGSPVNFSGKLYDIASYGLDPETETIDYDDVAAQAREHRPKMIIAGASAYPRAIDFARFKEIADEVGAYLLVDMAHIAGLVATGAHQNPVDYADVVTSTSHKTLRGPRGGFILTNDEGLAKKINSAVFPGAQGGPLMHIVAAKAVAFGEALKPEFGQYIERVLQNADALGRGMTDGGLRLVSNGTDNHLLLVDLTAAGEVTGKDAERILEDVGITVNKNTIPNEQRSPFVTSGIRVGSAAITTRGFDAEESYEIGTLIAKAIFESEKDGVLTDVTNRVAELVSRHPLYPELLTFRA